MTMRYIALAAALAALSFTASPAEAERISCKQFASMILNEMAQYATTSEYKWRAIVRVGQNGLREQGCDPVGSGFNVGAAGMRVDVMLYGHTDPGGY